MKRSGARRLGLDVHSLWTTGDALSVWDRTGRLLEAGEDICPQGRRFLLPEASIPGSSRRPDLGSASRTS